MAKRRTLLQGGQRVCDSESSPGGQTGTAPARTFLSLSVDLIGTGLACAPYAIGKRTHVGLTPVNNAVILLAEGERDQAIIAPVYDPARAMRLSVEEVVYRFMQRYNPTPGTRSSSISSPMNLPIIRDRVLGPDQRAVAYCLPGLRPRIVLSDGTLGLLGRDELSAVIHRERGHAQEHHGQVMLPIGRVATAGRVDSLRHVCIHKCLVAP